MSCHLQHEPLGGLMAGRRLLHRETNLQRERREPSFLNVRLFAIIFEARAGTAEGI